MSKIFVRVGAMVGGYLGWWLGSRFGMMSAFLLSVVFAGAGLVVGRRVEDHLVS